MMNGIHTARERAGAAVAEMIVMGPDHDGFLGMRPFAFQYADHVFDRRFGSLDIGFGQKSAIL